jgi:hypothetical protein
VVTAVAGCSEDPAVQPPPPPAAPASAPPEPAAAAEGEADVALPEGTLRDLVPAPADVPAGLVPLLQTSGPRDAAAVAAFSADPEAAATALAEHGFTDAYVAQYASPSDSRTLTAVVVRFRDADGARADLDADVESGAGVPVDADGPIGDASDVRRVDLPGDGADELLTVRFRAGSTTWLLAWRAPRPADPQVPVALARALSERA